MPITIEKDIPMPSPRATYSKYPFDMCAEIGDSFLIPTDEPKATIARVRAAAERNRIRTGKKFRARVVQEEAGVRCWRVQ
jgi:hypothetical protein